jgi:hypothetical protein
MVAMTRLLSLLAAYAAQSALFDAEDQLWPDLLKQGFNCRDLARTWYQPGNDPR